jgi:DNA-nicking Smr family endonuclease
MGKRRGKDPRVAKMPEAPEPHHDDCDARAFEREMADVVRLPADPRGRIRTVRPINPKSAATSSAGRPGHPDGDAEPDHDFTAPGVDRREIRKLKRGEYAVGGRRDLHGMTAADACASVKQFIDNSRHSRHRCVCIVHGRGLHSERMTSVVKARVRSYLRTHPSVLAYADAPASDGGPGAVYVLLRSK